MAAVLSVVEVEVTVGMTPGRRRADSPDAPVVVPVVARRGKGVVLNEQVTVYAAYSLAVVVSQGTVALP